ncbi:MAG: type II secretion system F family protein [Pseudomonadota bacterium]|nr:type II secretion system F family protein [Pseudomonadota bacterium]
MPPYRYSAIDDKGRKIRGTVAADNEADLETRLKRIGLDLISAREDKIRRPSWFGRIPLDSLIVLCVHLEQLIRAGVPLHEALADVRDSTESSRLRDVLTGVSESVRNGEMLSRAMAAYPRVFDEVFTGLVATGEKTGNLAEAFAHLAAHLKWSADIRRKIRIAVRYPLVLLLALAGVIAIMMAFVVPRLVDFIQSQGFGLPLHTRALIAVSRAVQHDWVLILGIPALAAALLMAGRRFSEPFAYGVDELMLRLPLIGPTIRKIDMARFTHFFSVMFTSGIDVLDALATAQGVMRNRALQAAVELARANVIEGNPLTSSLRLSNQFPTLVTRMFKVGEDSGNMKEALENINFFYDREVNDSVSALIGAIQPALTAVMGVLIFWVIAAVFGPLYESFSRMAF